MSEHIHEFATKQERVPLYKYVAEDGENKNYGIRGSDLLTIRYCTIQGCTYRETIDLERTS